MPVIRARAAALCAGLFAAAPAPARAEDPRLTLEEAIDLAQAQAIEVVRAKHDLRYADVEKMRALALILPKFYVYALARENFSGSVIEEFRNRSDVKAPDQCVTDPTDPACQLPGVFNFGPFRERQGDPISEPWFYLSVSARQTLFDGGRWWTQLARADDVEAQRRHALQIVRNNVRLNVSVGFYELAKALRTVETWERQLQLSEAQLERARAALDSKKGSPSDVAAAERNLAQDRVTLAQLRLAATSRRRSLNLALARSPDTAFEIAVPASVSTATIALAPIALPPNEALLELAIARRPELAQSRAIIDILQRNLDSRRGEYWPVASVVASYTRASRRPARVFASDPTTNYYANVGVELTWDPFIGRQTDASVLEAEIGLSRGRVDYEDLMRWIKSDVLERIERLGVLREVHRLAVDGVRAAEEAVRLADANYRGGRATSLELRDAEQRLTQARLEAVLGRINIEVAREELRRAVGDDPWAPGTSPEASDSRRTR